MKYNDYLRTANLLTYSRFLLTIPFILCFRYELMKPAAICFGIASLTDLFDGKIARKQGITQFGSFLDSFVDKILIGAALICLYFFQHENLDNGAHLIPLWMVYVILGREIVVTVSRIFIVARHGEVISANRWGKYKTVSQVIVILIGLVLLAIPSGASIVVQKHGPIYFLMYLPLIMTVTSGLEFFYCNLRPHSA